MRFSVRTLPVFLLLLLSPLAARADTVVINSGFVGHGNPALASFPGWNFNFSGQGLSARGIGEKLGDNSTQSCVFCAPGETLSARFVVSTFSGNELGGNSITTGGAAHNFVWYSGSRFEFALAPVVLPSSATSAPLTITTPFTFSGRLAGLEPPFSNSPFTFSYDLTGQGIATLNFGLRTVNGALVWALQSVRYDFQPAAVPEPATFALLGAGLAGLAARRHRRRRARVV